MVVRNFPKCEVGWCTIRTMPMTTLGNTPCELSEGGGLSGEEVGSVARKLRILTPRGYRKLPDRASTTQPISETHRVEKHPKNSHSTDR